LSLAHKDPEWNFLMNATTPMADERGAYLLYVDLIGSSPLVEKIGDDRVPRVAQRKEKVSHHE
jgi:hypothetical protein